MAELEQEREMREAMRDLEKSQNMIKYKDEIENRPKKEWFIGKRRREEISKESKANLKEIKSKFEAEGYTKKKREKKQKDKKEKQQNQQNQ